jgi:hypothetical protein
MAHPGPAARPALRLLPAGSGHQIVPARIYEDTAETKPAFRPISNWKPLEMLMRDELIPTRNIIVHQPSKRTRLQKMGRLS